MRIRIVAAVLVAASLAGAAAAQGLTVQSISGPSPALGQVVSAASGTTIFQVSASGGMVTRLSGTGFRLGGGSGRPLVTLACGTDDLCATSDVAVTVSSASSPTGRAGTLANFTIQSVTAQIQSGPSGTDPVTFTIAPIGTNATKTFAIGADFPILGDDSPRDTGPATSAFQVTAHFTPTGGSDMAMGTATATVLRPLTIANTHGLLFGKIVKPRTGSGTVTIDATTGEPAYTGDGVRGVGTPPTAATYQVTGEGGQTFSLHVPDSFTMAGTSGSIEVTLAPSGDSVEVLDGSIGSAASMNFAVGGSFAIDTETAEGAYSGSFAVTVQYQ